MRLVSLLLIWALPSGLAAQDLSQQLARLPDGTVRLSFAARAGVCGSGEHNINVSDPGDEWEADCADQPVRVALQLSGRRVVAVRTYVGGRWRPDSAAKDLGMVSAPEASRYFLELAGRPEELSGDPVFPAALADSAVIWPALIRLARDSRLPEERRRTAVFWLSQQAGAVAGRALDSIAGDDRGNLEIRKQAVFALSQRPPDEGVPALIRVVRTNHDPELRKTALFWLGQTDDPRALEVFEEILR